MKFAWQQIPDSIISEILTHLEIEGIVLDDEHGTFNETTLFRCIQTICLAKKEAYVRLSKIDNKKIKMCLDAGATGLIFSTIENDIQAATIQKLTSYPSFGGVRGLGLVRQNAWGKKNLLTKPPVLIAQIENVTAMNNLKSIVKKEVFDYYMIGPYDLSASLGVTSNFNSTVFSKAIEKFDNIVPVKKRGIHIPRDVNSQIEKYNDYGFIAVGMDTITILERYEGVE